MMLRLLLGVWCLAGPALSLCVGSIHVQGYGEAWVLAPDWAADTIQVHDNGFTMTGNSRLYLGTRAEDGWHEDMYWQVPLMDRHFTYTVDLSGVGCNCYAAAYFVSMPGSNPGYEGDYYCDANHGNDAWCPEYDLLEGNKWTIVSTLHICNSEEGAWVNCDRGGCATSAYYQDPSMMCPEDRCTINTNKPFKMSHFQNTHQAITSLKQGDADASFNICPDGGYIANMAASYEGMVFTAALWGGGWDASWTWDDMICGGDCNADAMRVTFTNFELHT